MSEVLSAILNASGYAGHAAHGGQSERLDNLAELKQSVYLYETTCGEECTLEHYLSHVALLTNSDTAEQGDKVKLMTVHAAKGLNFLCVLVRHERGHFPIAQGAHAAGDGGGTPSCVRGAHARGTAAVSVRGDGRNFDGSPRYPSRFVLDIGRNRLTFTQPPQEGLIRETESYIESTQRFFPTQDSDNVFPVGQRVRHLMFGEGTVLEVDMENGAHLVQFDDMPTPRKISFRAKLERC